MLLDIKTPHPNPAKIIPVTRPLKIKYINIYLLLIWKMSKS